MLNQAFGLEHAMKARLAGQVAVFVAFPERVEGPAGFRRHAPARADPARRIRAQGPAGRRPVGRGVRLGEHPAGH
jgi:hypothetical protein